MTSQPERTQYTTIPVPSDAVSVASAVTPNTQYTSVRIWKWNGTKYSIQTTFSFTVGGASGTFTAGEDLYLTLVGKQNSSGTAYTVEPSEITINFSTT